MLEEPVGLPLGVNGSSQILLDFSHGEPCPVLRLNLAITIPISELLTALTAFQLDPSQQLALDGVDIFSGFLAKPGMDQQHAPSTEGFRTPVGAAPGSVGGRTGSVPSTRRVVKAANEQMAIPSRSAPAKAEMTRESSKVKSRAAPDTGGIQSDGGAADRPYIGASPVSVEVGATATGEAGTTAGDAGQPLPPGGLPGIWIKRQKCYWNTTTQEKIWTAPKDALVDWVEGKNQNGQFFFQNKTTGDFRWTAPVQEPGLSDSTTPLPEAT